MAGWDGAGNFTLPYQFAVDAANGVKILSSKQDTQWATVTGGIMNALCRDGQNKVIGNLDINNHRLINLAAPVSATDAARMQDVTSVSPNEWVAETASVVWVGSSQFKVVGVDRTATYTSGRHLKIIHNTGSTTTYFTVNGSNFSTDTNVFLSPNVGLVSSVTSVSYGFLNSPNTSAPLVCACGFTAGSTNLVSNTNYAIGKQSTPFAFSGGAPNYNVGNILDVTTGNINISPGVWLLGYSVRLIRNGANITSAGYVFFAGGTVVALSGGVGAFPPVNTDNVTSVNGTSMLIIGQNTAVTCQIQAPVFTGGPVQDAQSSLWVAKIA